MNATAARTATVEIAAPDGTVRLYAPDLPGEPWQALTLPAGAKRSTEVAWTRGHPSRYVCAQHGLSHRYDACPHTLAAVRAATEYERRTT